MMLAGAARCGQRQLRFWSSKASLSTAKSAQMAPKAAVCVIGNEVLTGKTHDTNSHFIARMMFRKGIDLVRVVVIPDEHEVIASTVKDLSDLVGPSGYVFTTGGIGPTHDDITYEGIAQAFGMGVKLHEPTLQALQEYLHKKHRSKQMNEDRKRMAILPEHCKILPTGSWVPLAVVHNVYILPGIPSLVTKMLSYNDDHFVGVPIHRAVVHTKLLEGDVASSLTNLQKEHPDVSLGSYVNWRRFVDQHKDSFGVSSSPRRREAGHAADQEDHEQIDPSYNVKVTVEGRNKQEVEEIADQLVEQIQGFRPPEGHDK